MRKALRAKEPMGAQSLGRLRLQMQPSPSRSGASGVGLAHRLSVFGGARRRRWCSSH